MARVLTRVLRSLAMGALLFFIGSLVSSASFSNVPSQHGCRHWTADEALDTYASLLWVGGDRHGVAVGAAFLFGKDVNHLTPADTALLVVMTRSPKTYNPLCHPERAREARNELLQRMLAAGLLDQKSFSEAVTSDLGALGSCEGATEAGAVGAAQ